MGKAFKAEHVAHHRQAYKIILADARHFVNATTLDDFTRQAYTKHLEGILDRLAAELGSLRDDAYRPERKPIAGGTCPVS